MVRRPSHLDYTAVVTSAQGALPARTGSLLSVGTASSVACPELPPGATGLCHGGWLPARRSIDIGFRRCLELGPQALRPEGDLRRLRARLVAVRRRDRLAE